MNMRQTREKSLLNSIFGGGKVKISRCSPIHKVAISIPIKDNQKVFSWKGKKSSKAQRKDLSIKFDEFLLKKMTHRLPTMESI